ncbi:ribonuclease H-like domain-containing protein [Tanacetum coccineum]
MWLFKHKFHPDGSLSRYKVRLVANDRSQQQGIDCEETLSPVVKLATICIVLSLAVSRLWPIYQLDIKNAFLHSHISETVYVHQPLGFVDLTHPDYGCLLYKSLYCLKQALRAWFQHFATYAIPTGFHETDYLLLYVDDIILIVSSSYLLQRIIESLHSEFSTTDLGLLNYFLGISAQRTSSGLFLSQAIYVIEILERAHTLNCNPYKTPVDTDFKLGPKGDLVADPTLFHSLAGAL